MPAYESSRAGIYERGDPSGSITLLYRKADFGAAQSPTHRRVEGEVLGHFYCSDAGFFDSVCLLDAVGSAQSANRAS